MHGAVAVQFALTTPPPSTTATGHPVLLCIFLDGVIKTDPFFLFKFHFSLISLLSLSSLPYRFWDNSPKLICPGLVPTLFVSSASLHPALALWLRWNL